MSRVLSAGLVLAAAGAASAQSTIIHQTSCVPSPTNGNSCFQAGAGFNLQSVSVDCSLGGGANQVVIALLSIADRNGPNRIVVSGSCTQAVFVYGFNRLTIEGTPGATIATGFGIANSSGITLKSLNITGAGLSVDGAQVVLDGVTVQNATGDAGITVGAGSQLGFTGAPSVITGNRGAGIAVNPGGVAKVANASISNNGFGCHRTLCEGGILVREGATLILANHVGSAAAPVEIFGNSGDGVHSEGGTLLSDAEFPSSTIHIHHNDLGIAMGWGTADLEGPFKIELNGPPGPSPFGPVPQIGVFYQAFLSIGGGAQITGEVGIGVIGHSSLLLGNGGPLTVDGAVGLEQGSFGVVAGGNSIGRLFCDSTSWVQNDSHTSAIGENACPENVPSGMAGPQGPKGDKGDKGDPGPGLISGMMIMLPAGSPAPTGYTLVGTFDLQPSGTNRGRPVQVPVDVYKRD